MKQAYRYLSILFILFFVVDTMRADGGDVLERIVRLPKSKGTVYSLLGNVSQQSGYMFIYDSKVIDNDAVVKIKGGERSIRQAVYDIVGDTGLEFQVIGTHILITLPSEKKIHIQQDSISEQPINFSITGTLLTHSACPASRHRRMLGFVILLIISAIMYGSSSSTFSMAIMKFSGLSAMNSSQNSTDLSRCHSLKYTKGT